MFNILVVEDNELIAVDLEDRLEKFGYSVANTLASGEDAIAYLNNNKKIDLILMDINLSGNMSGIETASIIRKSLDVPVVYLTGSDFSDKDKLEKLVSSGSYGYISKPYEERALFASIEIALCKFKSDREKRELIAQLQDALAHIKTLQGILPICASCKNIRDDKGYWNQLEGYISQHTDVLFSHGICPTCAAKLYPGINLYKKEKTE